MKRDKKYNGKLEKTKFISVILLPIEICLPFHDVNHLIMDSTTESKMEKHNGLHVVNSQKPPKNAHTVIQNEDRDEGTSDKDGFVDNVDDHGASRAEDLDIEFVD